MPIDDHELRCLRDEDAHLAAARMLPEAGEWLDRRRSAPIGPVAVMGQERNVLRSFFANGRPLALGLHPIGDARCQTDSFYAWGAGTALSHAVAPADVLRDGAADEVSRAEEFEQRIAGEAGALHAISLERERAWLGAYRGEHASDGAGPASVETALESAARRDPEIFRPW